MNGIKNLLSWLGMSSKQLASLLVLLVIWRVALQMVVLLADHVLPYDPSFPYASALLMKSGLPRSIYSWANFDGVHYLTIAAKGYVGTGLIQAFFPVYPGTIAGLHWLSGGLISHLVAGLVISHLAFAMAMIAFWAWAKRFSSSSVAWVATGALLLWPTSFFLVSLYSESLFLLVVMVCLLTLQRRAWVPAALLAAVAGATRVVGVGLMLGVWLEWLLVHWPLLKARKWRTAVSWQTGLVAILPLVGLVSYMIFLWSEFRDPLYFLHVQAEFGGGRQEQIVLVPQVAWRYFKMMATVRPFDWKYFALVQEFASALVVAGLLVVMALRGWLGKKTRSDFPWGALAFSAIAWIVPTFTGTFSSMPRYVLVCVPAWLVLGQWLSSRRLLKLAWYLAGGLVLVINMVLFIQGYWVA